MRKTEKNIRWTQKLQNDNFTNIKFEELEVISKSIKNCRFDFIEFKHSRLGSNTLYEGCFFNNCTFTGKYASLGNPTEYKDCRFINCKFKGTMMFLGSTFEHCKFSGKMTNNIIQEEKRFFSKPYKFNHCDLSNIIFDNITLKGSRLFKNCELSENQKNLLSIYQKSNNSN